MLLDTFDSNWIAPLGPHVDAFEREFAQWLGVTEAAALSSGTAALHLALLMLGVQPGDEVVVPTLTFVASANAVLYAGATPGSGLAVFRLRRRGRAIEAVLCDQLVPDAATGEDLVRSLARGTQADYVIRIPDGVTRGRFIRLPRTGPVLACRVLDGPDGLEALVPPALGEWALTMGDVELL